MHFVHQFLEQKYGYYHCRECNLRWESAYVWCVQGTNKVSIFSVECNSDTGKCTDRAWGGMKFCLIQI